jgi:hypothetical protein
MKSNAPTYSLKVWLTAVAGGSLGVDFLMGGLHNGAFGFMLSMIICLLFSLGCSLPSFIVFIISVFRLERTQLSITNIKIILSVLGLALTVLPFLVLVYLHYISLSYFSLLLPYVSVIIASIWFYKLKTELETISTL